LEVSNTHTTCPWKGTASYYNLVFDDGTTVKDAAWFYPEPKSGAANIKDFVAFCKSPFSPAILIRHRRMS
jgi:uncharacterized protein (DUF427 family)